MFWNRDKDKNKNTQDGQTPAEERPRRRPLAKSSHLAKTGSFFRTVNFHMAGDDVSSANPNRVTHWLEAAENPNTRKWRVFEVVRKPNVETSGVQSSDFITHRTTMDGCEDVLLDKALSTLLKYERSQAGMGYAKGSDSPADYGDEHVYQFALNEGKAPDIQGNIHPTVEGRVVSEGMFSDTTLTSIRDIFNNPPEIEHETVVESGFNLLMGQIDEVSDISRLLSTIKERNNWGALIEKAAEAMNALSALQIQGQLYDAMPMLEEKRDFKERLTMVTFDKSWERERIAQHEHDVNQYRQPTRPVLHREVQFRQAIEALHQQALDSGLINVTGSFSDPNDDTSRGILFDLDDGFDAVDDLFESGGPFDTDDLFSDDDEDMLLVLGTQEDRKTNSNTDHSNKDGALAAEDFLMKMTGSIELALEIAYAKYLFNNVQGGKNDSRLLKRLESHIDYVIDMARNQGATEIDIKRLNAEIIAPIEPFALADRYDLDRLKALSKTYGLEIGRDDLEANGLIYFPEALLEYLETCDEIAIKLEAAVEEEKARIAHEKSALQSAFADSTAGTFGGNGTNQEPEFDAEGGIRPSVTDSNNKQNPNRRLTP